jgi:hypothetical protein
MLTRGRTTLLTTSITALAVAAAGAPATALAARSGDKPAYGKKSDTAGSDHGGKPAGAGTGRRIR